MKTAYRFGYGRVGVRPDRNNVSLDLIKLDRPVTIGKPWDKQVETTDVLNLKFDSKDSLDILIAALTHLRGVFKS